MEIVGTILGLIALLFVLAVGGLLVSALAIPPKDDQIKEQERQAALEQEQERAAAREAEQRVRYLGDWASERGHQYPGRMDGDGYQGDDPRA
jgi:hypothetical protein